MTARLNGSVAGSAPTGADGKVVFADRRMVPHEISVVVPDGSPFAAPRPAFTGGMPQSNGLVVYLIPPDGYGILSLSTQLLGEASDLVLTVWRVRPDGGFERVLDIPTTGGSVPMMVPDGSYRVQVTGRYDDDTPLEVWWPSAATSAGSSDVLLNAIFGQASAFFQVGRTTGTLRIMLEGLSQGSSAPGRLEVVSAVDGSVIASFNMQSNAPQRAVAVTGPVMVHFIPNVGSGLAEEWYEDALTPETGTVVVVHRDTDEYITMNLNRST